MNAFYLWLLAHLLLFLLIFGGSITTETDANDKLIDEISVRTLKIVDSKGRTAIMLKADEDATTLVLGKYDKNNQRCGVIGLNVEDTLSSITLFDENIGTPTRLFKQKDGRSGLSVTNQADDMPMLIGYHPDSGGYIMTTTPTGKLNGELGDSPFDELILQLMRVRE